MPRRAHAIEQSGSTYSLASISLQAAALQAEYRLEQVVEGMGVPWAIAFLPNGDLLVTERSGDLLRVKDGKVVGKIEGVPEVRARGQGGLLDAVLHPEFETNRFVYLSYSDASGPGGSNTSIARGKLEGDALVDVECFIGQRRIPATVGI